MMNEFKRPALTEDGNGNKTHYHADEVDQLLAQLQTEIEAQAQYVLKPTVFTFTDPDRPCTYWSSKFHVIANGVCRCGINVRIVEMST